MKIHACLQSIYYEFYMPLAYFFYNGSKNTLNEVFTYNVFVLLTKNKLLVGLFSNTCQNNLRFISLESVGLPS